MGGETHHTGKASHALAARVQGDFRRAKCRFTHRAISYGEACAFVDANHRHHKAPRGHRFSIGAFEGGQLIGVVMVGRPLARLIDPWEAAEVTRLCTDGTKNACSFLYGRAARAAFALGYARLITYSLPEEGGASLRGAGFELVRTTFGGVWSRDQRVRADDHPTSPKWRWERAA